MTKQEAKTRINELQLLRNSVGDYCPQPVRDYIMDRITAITMFSLQREKRTSDELPERDYYEGDSPDF